MIAEYVDSDYALAGYVGNDYSALITSEHQTKPKFVAAIQALTAGFADGLGSEASVIINYDLDAAVGNQLDLIGQWVGIPRQITVPLTGVYFAWDTAGVGWDFGSWQGPYDPTSGLASLPDDAYKLLIRAKIGANHWDGTVPSLLILLNQAFQGSGSLVFAIDNQDMTMTIGVAGAIPTNIIVGLLRGGYLVPKPSGVAINYLVTSAAGAPIFGWDVASPSIAGWDVGAWGV